MDGWVLRLGQMNSKIAQSNMSISQDLTRVLFAVSFESEIPRVGKSQVGWPVTVSR